MEKSKDWRGNSQAVMKNIGANNHCDHDYEKYAYYATEPKAVKLLFKLEEFSENIWECACGELHLSKEMERIGKTVRSIDIIVRCNGVEQLDFLDITNNQTWCGDIITNPPYIYASEFILKGLSLLRDAGKLALLFPLRYLDGKARKQLFSKFPPKTVYVSSGRLKCAMNGNFEQMTGSAVCYDWFVWQKSFTGTTELKWFN